MRHVLNLPRPERRLLLFFKGGPIGCDAILTPSVFNRRRRTHLAQRINIDNAPFGYAHSCQGAVGREWTQVVKQFDGVDFVRLVAQRQHLFMTTNTLLYLPNPATEQVACSFQIAVHAVQPPAEAEEQIRRECVDDVRVHNGLRHHFLGLQAFGPDLENRAVPHSAVAHSVLVEPLQRGVFNARSRNAARRHQLDRQQAAERMKNGGAAA